MAGVDVPGWADVMANRIDRVSTVETSPGHRLVMLAAFALTSPGPPAD
ncbi:MAG: hypothetical protein ABWZ26_01995 [Candidatus Nanopelagicales bacterium]